MRANDAARPGTALPVSAGRRATHTRFASDHRWGCQIPRQRAACRFEGSPLRDRALGEALRKPAGAPFDLFPGEAKPDKESRMGGLPWPAESESAGGPEPVFVTYLR